MKIDRKLVWIKYQGHCAYCGKHIEIKDMQVDHLKPKAHCMPIGRDIEGKYIYPDINAYNNLMPSCRRCNHYKRAETFENFKKLIATIHERIKNNYICKVAEDFGIIEYHKWDGIFYFEKEDLPIITPQE